MTDFAISINDVRAAQKRIARYSLRTPLVFSEPLSREHGCRIHFKAENLQCVGAFKARGAANAVMLLSDAAAARGVVTHSSGNHAAALARAAGLRSIPAFVVMPGNSARNKIAAVRSYGVEPVFCEPTAESRAETAESLRRQTGATMIHPYDDPTVMAGQGTVGLEVLEQLPDVDAIFVPVGGGGLLAGILTAVKALHPAVKVIAAEPELADDTARSLRSGRREMPARYDSVADGLRTSVGELTFPIIRSLLDDIVLVSEQSIIEATRAIAQRAHLIAEPSGAVAFAALTQTAKRFAGQSVAVVISGGNLDLDAFHLGAE
jgi:threonine dehydratase